MAILAFQQPEKVIMIESDNYKGKFEFRPLEPGYGNTIGNALRRILLSSLEGFAITAVRIEGVDHEFDTIHGVVEDMTEIILNLKRLSFKRQIEEQESEEVSFKIEGKTTFLASEINKYLNAFQVLNTDVEICHMTSDVSLNITMRIEKGRGYVPSEENVRSNDPVGTIAIDSIFTPIKNVKYSVENYRVGQRTDYDKLVFDIETDGSITPKDALKEAAQILIQHLVLFSDKKIDIQTDIQNQTDDFDEETLHIRQMLKTRLVDMDLSVRALNCLKAAEVDTLGDLVQIAKSELLKFRNFGRKSLTELENLVKSKNLEFGMDISKYKLEKE
ncbi:MAG: DNA-directed RNA polymerase subunit alpha [Bacteroidales bacterium]|jgi:DNA-directed RNA polymerase subunit alpha|nr:DNA-directed RNA polymerase subunit alpha [Bacteroidales bacterium]MDY6382007.1 DNA-directed RNA polymerase subunit alpha [Bacteroidales bacterium]MDY6395382.1 DNA-directed RNA polymerase subunit alpha [Bacteroidales bacterium]MDY6402515.1 DNA-directed RNA polymerase subunit alpha [Bacteroidales bacterium]MDY6424651.1 DNA-directed RNA polymerase subunit alpha [Bacteroidales bacterium]